MKYIVVVLVGTLLTIYTLLNYYIGYNGWKLFSKITPWLNWKVYWIIFWFIAFSFFLGRFLSKVLPYSVNNILKVIGSYWLGIMFYSLIILLTIEVIKLFNGWFKFLPNTLVGNNGIQIVGLFVISFIALIMIYGAWNARNPIVRHYDINIPKTVQNMDNLHIVAVSDIHLGVIVDQSRIRQASQIINELKPDLVLFAGDTIDEDIDIFKEKDMVNIFRSIKSKYGNYAVLGNHEYFGGHMSEAIHYIEKSGIKVLLDNYVVVNDAIYLVGREDKTKDRMGNKTRKSLNEILIDIDKSKPIIVLDHQPANLEEPEKNGVDLQISGHTHKGQIFPNNFITSSIFENDGGYLKKGNLHTIVSPGFGTWGPPIRIGNRPEIVDINIIFK